MADVLSLHTLPKEENTYSLVWDDTDLVQNLSTRQKLSHGTIVTRKSRIKIFYTWIKENDLPLISITIEKFFYHLKTVKGMTNGSSLNTYITALNTYQAYLLKRGLTYTFMDDFDRYDEEDPDIIPLTPKEIWLIKNYCLRPAQSPLEYAQNALTIFLIDFGARLEDGQNFRVKDVDIPGSQISYVQLKTGVQRTLHLEDPLMSILNKLIQGKGLNDHVFQNSVGGIIHAPDYRQFIKKIGKQVGIVKIINPHIFRHSYSQNSYDVTGDIYLLKDLRKDKSIRTTMRYAKNSPAKLKLAQQIHPHLQGSVDPKERIHLLEKDLTKHALSQDQQFDAIKVQQATNAYLSALYGSIKQNEGIINLP